MTQTIEHDRAMLEGQIAFANNGIRHLILINGAAAIALLTFLGHIDDKTRAAIDLASLTCAMTAFSTGVAVTAACALFAYLFQTAVRECERLVWLAPMLRGIGIFLAASAIGLFVWGVNIAGHAFVEQPSQTETIVSTTTFTLVREGKYVAEVSVNRIEDDSGWSPYLSTSDAQKLDAVRAALRRGDISATAKFGRVFELSPVQSE